MIETNPRYFEAIRWIVASWFLMFAGMIAPAHGTYIGNLVSAAEFARDKVKNCLDV